MIPYTYRDYRMPKPWYTSKTIWIAVIQAVIAVYAAFITVNPEIQTIAGMALIKSALDIIIRLLTIQPTQ